MKKTARYGLLLLGLLIAAACPGQRRGAAAPPRGMVLVPAGSYTPFIRTASASAPVHVRSFYLDETAVTNRQFLAFVKVNPAWARSKVSPLYADGNYLRHWASDSAVGDDRILNSPVTNVSWFAARAYSIWAGKRLPTMAEWEYAGASLPQGETRGTRLTTIILEWYSHPNPQVLGPVKSTYRNGFGVYDMHGLIWEWVDDFNSVLPRGATNNLFCAAGTEQATDKEDYAAFMRYAFRESLRAAYTVANLGFRCAMDAPQSR